MPTEQHQIATTGRRETETLVARGLKSALVGGILNTSIAVAKLTAGVTGHSFALIADGIESCADVLSSLVIYFGLRLAIKPADSDHPYGHGKAEPIAALIVGIALAFAGLAIGVQSVRQIITPHMSPKPFTLIVLAGVLVIKEVLFRYVSGVGQQIGSSAVETDAWHHRSDAIMSGLAFIGISVALLGGPGWESADAWAALIASLIILYGAFVRIKIPIAELADQAPPATIAGDVKTVARDVPGVLDLEKCFVRKMGFDYYVDLHVIVDGNLAVREGHRIAHEVEDAILKRVPRIAEVLVHIEPDR